MLLENRSFLVTGGAGRLGRAIAATLLREGADVALADRDSARLQSTLDSFGGSTARRVVGVVGDVSEEDDVERMVREVAAKLDRVDGLVNAHGIFPNCPVLEVQVDEWDRVFAVNVRGSMLTARALARSWVAEKITGSIVNVSSGAARSARAGGAHYTGSKAAVNMLTEVLAIELGPHGIRVNAVAPGLVLDDVITEERDEQHPYVNLMLRGTPLGRTGSPQDVAEAVAFLASDRSSWTTGAVLEVTGGSHCGRTHVPLTRTLR